ncbi:tRNA (adenosine(37)-N6)-dimethylallyltransferase MiaA [Candidatus Woesebacteria bacterium]|nr:tRNA (adenosine(37)-N6)-dimethylallyltransferase MiaA [Candidatus Woesebacteria bacterium]
MDTIYIVGTTGSGKTKLALRLAELRESVIISADSRQVYKGMDIVTGKDHPRNIKIHGIDLVDPNDECSVSVWYKHVAPVIKNAHDAGHQVIVVGGTGFYVRALTHGIETMSVPINPELRSQLETLGVSELQEMLKSLDPDRFVRFNHSDQNNPRRLIRAIEVAKSSVSVSQNSAPNTQTMIALHYEDLNMQEHVIRERVLARLADGAVLETQELLKSIDINAKSLSALGYSEITKYLRGEISESQLVGEWVRAELNYAKRQLTFFRKQNVVWYDRGRMSIEEIYEQYLSR